MIPKNGSTGHPAIEIAGYTNKTCRRRLRVDFSFLVHGGGLRLCRRDFNRRVLFNFRSLQITDRSDRLFQDCNFLPGKFFGVRQKIFGAEN
jgi:hypothetical protein